MEKLKNFIDEIDDVKLNALEKQIIPIKRAVQNCKFMIAAVERNRANNSILILLINPEAEKYNNRAFNIVMKDLDKLKRKHQVFDCLLNNVASIWQDANFQFPKSCMEAFIQRVHRELGGYVIVEIYDPLMQHNSQLSPYNYENGFDIIEMNTHVARCELNSNFQTQFRKIFADILGQDYENALKVEKYYLTMVRELSKVAELENESKRTLREISMHQIQAEDAEANFKKAKKDYPELFSDINSELFEL